MDGFAERNPAIGAATCNRVEALRSVREHGVMLT